MTPPDQSPSIVLSGSYGHANFGDQQLERVSSKLLRHGFPNHQTTVLTRTLVDGSPIRESADARQESPRYGVPWKLLRDSDLFLFGGGTLFTSKPNQEGAAVLFATRNMLSAIALGTPAGIVGAGIGSLSESEAPLVRRALDAATITHFRDLGSLTAIGKTSSDNGVLADLVELDHGIDSYTMAPATDRFGTGFAFSATEATRLVRAYGHDARTRFQYLDERLAASAGDELIELASSPADAESVSEFFPLSSERFSRSVRLWELSKSQAEAEVASLGKVLTMRYHVLMLALFVGTPAAATALDPKVVNLLKSQGRPTEAFLPWPGPNDAVDAWLAHSATTADAMPESSWPTQNDWLDLVERLQTARTQKPTRAQRIEAVRLLARAYGSLAQTRAKPIMAKLRR